MITRLRRWWNRNTNPGQPTQPLPDLSTITRDQLRAAVRDGQRVR